MSDLVILMEFGRWHDDSVLLHPMRRRSSLHVGLAAVVSPSKITLVGRIAMGRYLLGRT